MQQPDPQRSSEVVRVFLATIGRWMGCDWPTRFGQLALNLNGLKASHARLLARATAGSEAADWLAAAQWLERVEADAHRAAESAELAADLALFGQFERALAFAQAACAIEAEYHRQPVWWALGAILSADWAGQVRQAAELPAARWRVLLVDDIPELLDLLEQFLSARRPDIAIVGRATSGRGAVEEAARLKPDLVLMDVEMPEMSGLEAARRLEAGPDAPYLILMTGNPDPAPEAEAKAVGVDGFIYKPHFRSRLLPLFDTLLQGADTPAHLRPTAPSSLGSRRFPVSVAAE